MSVLHVVVGVGVMLAVGGLAGLFVVVVVVAIFARFALAAQCARQAQDAHSAPTALRAPWSPYAPAKARRFLRFCGSCLIGKYSKDLRTATVRGLDDYDVSNVYKDRVWNVQARCALLLWDIHILDT